MSSRGQQCRATGNRAEDNKKIMMPSNVLPVRCKVPKGGSSGETGIPW